MHCRLRFCILFVRDTLHAPSSPKLTVFILPPSIHPSRHTRNRTQEYLNVPSPPSLPSLSP